MVPSITSWTGLVDRRRSDNDRCRLLEAMVHGDMMESCHIRTDSMYCIFRPILDHCRLCADHYRQKTHTRCDSHCCSCFAAGHSLLRAEVMRHIISPQSGRAPRLGCPLGLLSSRNPRFSNIAPTNDLESSFLPPQRTSIHTKKPG